MKIDINGYYTAVSGAGSVSEVCGELAAFGETSLLIVMGSPEFRAEGVFPAEVPFITAYASDDEVSDEVRSAFDLVIPAEGIEEYTGKLFKDKTIKQVREINACFITARHGSQEDVLKCESRAFYRLMAEKNGGSSNE